MSDPDREYDAAEENSDHRVDRRSLLVGGGLTAMAAVAATVAGSSSGFVERLLGDRFEELSPERKAEILDDLERKYSQRFGRDVEVADTAPMEGVVFGYGLDIARCVGCRRCVYACVDENNQSRDPQIHWIRVLRMEKEHGIELAGSNAYYEPAEVPEPDAFYVPVACQQCRNPACVKVCPVKATWQEPDGIVVIDYDWCIGCRCCMSACPYGARHFNWAEPVISSEELNPKTHYLGNRPRPRGVVEKCTFCIHRVREGRYPACVEICPVGARKFGNLLDEASEMRYLMREKRVFVLKEELNTQPRFYYFFAT
ncbi:MAG: 4Fe-4S dicluster domain-containing protein [Acidobacteria bacterium]|nr:4Fe-4S dicluster domain-containing protein [Candidatus Sulfomarinibacter sp. MAG AM1]